MFQNFNKNENFIYIYWIFHAFDDEAIEATVKRKLIFQQEFEKNLRWKSVRVDMY